MDRVLATSLAYNAVKYLESGKNESVCIGMVSGVVKVTGIKEMADEMDKVHRRPKTQWWRGLQEVQNVYGLIYNEQ
jgi:6-phosphofructokinase